MGFTVTQDNHADFTVVSNCFIDQYMEDANDAQLKIYLYLLRTLGVGKSTSVCEIADRFNYTEKDVMRALIYWEKKGVLTLSFDENKYLTGVCFKTLRESGTAESVSVPSRSDTPEIKSDSPKQIADVVSASRPSEDSSSDVVRPFVTVIRGEEPTPEPAHTKPSYTADQLKSFLSGENASRLIFIAEQYLQRALTPAEMKTILFLSDGLSFSEELIDYLLEYCIGHGKKDMRYIEKVAINWADNGVTSAKQAAKYVQKYDKIVYQIMNALGKNSNSPTKAEVDFIQKWTGTYGYDFTVIQVACERTVLATDRHRFEYADGILTNWFRSGIHHKTDIQKQDDEHRKTSRSAAKPKGSTPNAFNQFQQNDYDFDALEQQLIGKK